MSRESATLAGRRFAESGMVDACTIVRRTGQTTDPDTGVVTPTTSAVYSGACRIQQSGGGGAPAGSSGGSGVGQAVVYQVPFVLQLPMSVDTVQVEDLVTVTASTLDTWLVGKTFWIKGLTAGSHKTARRYPMELVTG